MAAGGFKEFVAGEVLDQDDINDFLMQGVLVFAGTAARGSAITAPVEGQFSFLKDSDSVEFYDGSAWQEFSTSPGSVVATGGTFGTVTVQGVDFGVHTFTSNGTISVTAGGEIEYLIVAGGGGGSGILQGTNGSDSILATVGTATGGGAGGDYENIAGNFGGSGGGGGSTTGSGGTATSGQGNDGGRSGSDFMPAGERCGGGGGGAASIGLSVGFARAAATRRAGDGGAGRQFDISGTMTYYAGGGGGGIRNSTAHEPGFGGIGGGGRGGGSGFTPVAGTANTGGGGGGGRGTTNDSVAGGGGGAGGLLYGFATIAVGDHAVTVGGGGAASEADTRAGGSGIVIVRYPL